MNREVARGFHSLPQRSPVDNDRESADGLRKVASEIHEATACAMMLEMGLEPKAICEKMGYPEQDAVVLAKDEGELETERLVRIGPCFFSHRVNGGSRGGHDGVESPGVVQIDEDEANRRLADAEVMDLEKSSLRVR